MRSGQGGIGIVTQAGDVSQVELVFVPSQDIARLAAQYLKDNLRRFDIGLVARRLLRSAAEEGNADWATYLLFDGGFAQQVIELGRRDALRRRDEIRAFCHA